MEALDLIRQSCPLSKASHQLCSNTLLHHKGTQGKEGTETPSPSNILLPRRITARIFGSEKKPGFLGLIAWRLSTSYIRPALCPKHRISSAAKALKGRRALRTPPVFWWRLSTSCIRPALCPKHRISSAATRFCITKALNLVDATFRFFQMALVALPWLSAWQAPPSKQVRCKAFPKSSQPAEEIYVAASASVEMSQPCRPCPKGPPATFLPTPPEIASMPTDSYELDRRARLNEEGKYLRVKSPRDIDWSKPLCEQLAAVLRGGPNPGTSHDELRAIRAQVPEMTTFILNGLFPADNVITATKCTRSICQNQQHGSSMQHIGSVYWISR